MQRLKSKKSPSIHLLKFRLTNFMEPECTCKIEEAISEINGVLRASLDPLNGLLLVEVKDPALESKVIRVLQECGYSCKKEVPVPVHR